MYMINVIYHLLAYNLVQKQYLNLDYGLKFELSTIMIICRYNTIHKIFLCVSVGQGIKTLHEKSGYFLVLCLMLLSSNA